MRVNRMYLFIISGLLMFSLTRGESPILIYAPEGRLYHPALKDTVSGKNFLGKTIDDQMQVLSGGKNAYIRLCSGQVVEMLPGSRMAISTTDTSLYLYEGRLVLHCEVGVKKFRYAIKVEKGGVGNLGKEAFEINLNHVIRTMPPNTFVLTANEVMPQEKIINQSSKDGQYILDWLKSPPVGDMTNPILLPSHQPKKFRFSANSKAGLATYETNRYYYTGALLKLRYGEFYFVYNIWLAVSNKGKFYSENWNEWKDIINNIYFIQLYKPESPFFLRIGLIEAMTFGRGYLVDNYDNTVMLPFEHLNGMEIQLKSKQRKLKLFVNDIGKPRVFGTYFSWMKSQDWMMDVTYIGDIDQYSNIKDKDDDSYPDMIDPQPGIHNHSSDSIILPLQLQRLDKMKDRSFHAISLGSEYTWLRMMKGEIVVSGEIAAFSKIGTGFTFPDISYKNQWVTVGVGADFQSPNFISSIFDRSYEYTKARFINDETGKPVLVSRAREVNDTKGWLYGWNTFFQLRMPGYIHIQSRYRDVQRGDIQDRLFSFSLQWSYPLVTYLDKFSFFIEHKNFETILDRKRDGQIWGFQFTITPHKTIDISVRYREQYQDKDGNTLITGSEAKRNFSLNANVNLDYWYKKWRKSKKTDLPLPPSN